MNYAKAEFLAAYGTAGQLPASDLPEIVFSGKSNVGKSSLINKFFNRRTLARVSAVPGKTTTVNFFGVEDVRFLGFAENARAPSPEWSLVMESLAIGLALTSRSKSSV